MGLSVITAPRPELLLDDLTERLAGPLPDPFDEDVIVVPNTGIRNWLRAALSHRLGILVRTRFVLPGALPELVVGAHADDESWHADRLDWHVLGRILAGDPLSTTTPWSAHPSRPWTIATRIADLLDEYAAQRPGMLTAWAAGDDRCGPEPDAASLAETQRWQAEVWRRLVATVPATPPAHRVAAFLGPRGSAVPRDALAPDLPSRLTVFGPGSVTDHAMRMVGLAAQHLDVAVLAVVPRAGATAPLAAWGARAHEVEDAVENLVRDERAPLERRTATPGSGTQLARLRDALAGLEVAAGRSSGGPTTARAGDGSVVVHACHGLVRQLEVARDAILHLLDADEDLLPRDVLVLCPDITRIAPLVGPVLGASVAHADGRPRRLAVQVVDRMAATEPAIPAMLVRILDAVTDRLTREDVETVLTSPPVRATLALDDDGVELVLALLEELQVRWGVDAEHRSRWGATTADAAGDGSWRDANDRAVAALLLHPERDRVVGVGDGPLAPARIADDSDLPLVGRVAEGIDALMTFARAAGAPATASTWARHTARLVRTLLRPTGGGEESGAWRTAADHVLDTLDALVRDAQDGAAAAVAIPAREWTRAVGERLTSRSAGAVPTAGVVQVGSLVGLRGVPARVVVLVDLDDTVLRPTTTDADDVLSATRRRGERDRGGEVRAALLDAVVSARDRIVITCDGRSVTTGEELPLPGAVEELCDALPEPTDDGLASTVRLVVMHPRHLADPRALGGRRGDQPPVPVPAGSGPWTFLPAALTLLQLQGADGHPVLGTEGLLVREVGDGLELVDPYASEPRTDDLVDLDLSDIVGALRDPARTYARRRLDLQLPEVEAVPARHVPLGLDRLQESAIGGELLRLRDPVAADRWRATFPARGGLPPEGLLDHALAATAMEVAALRELVPEVRGEPEVRGAELLLTVEGRRVRLTAALPAVGGRLVDASFVKDHPREQVSAWLHLLVATVADPEQPWIEEAVVVRRAGRGADGREQKGPVRHVLRIAGGDAPARRAAAAEALHTLVGLVLRVREAPQPLLGRASWLLGAPGVAVTNLQKELDRDLYDASTVLILGRPTGADLGRLFVHDVDGRSVTASDLSAALRAAHRGSLEVRTHVERAA